MSQPFFFHTGIIVGKNAAGNAHQFGTLQSGSVDLASTTKDLQGQNQFAVAVGVGAGKITGKASWANIDLGSYNDLYFAGAGTLSTGNVKLKYAEAAQIPTSTAYTVTVANGATFAEDYGVQFSDGTQLALVSASPAAGQYSVNSTTGVYTFAAADEGKAVLITYKYTVSGSGQSLQVTNQPVGAANNFKLVLAGQYNGVWTAITLYACVSSKLTFATKLNDFMIPDFEFSAFADANGNVTRFDTDASAAA
jgi:hypothetical protein